MHLPRKEHFSVKFMEDLEVLVGGVAVEICQKHIKVCIYKVSLLLWLQNLFYMIS